MLHGDSLGSIDIGSPIFYRRVQVGQVVGFSLDKDGTGVTMQVFVARRSTSTSAPTRAGGMRAASTCGSIRAASS